MKGYYKEDTHMLFSNAQRTKRGNQFISFKENCVKTLKWTIKGCHGLSILKKYLKRAAADGFFIERFKYLTS